MKVLYPICLFLFGCQMIASAQLNINGRLRYGNEWIQYDQTYYKVPVAEDGIFRIPFQTLIAQGIDVSKLNQIQVYHLGDPIPIYIGENYIEFFGRKHRSQLDQHLYLNGEKDMLNPAYSIITDTSAYFLTVASSSGATMLRYQAVSNDLNNTPAPESWFWRDTTVAYTRDYVQLYYPSDLSESRFEPGEGYAQLQSINSAFDLKIAPQRRFAGNMADSLEIRLTGAGNNQHTVLVNVNNVQIDKLEAVKYQLWQKTYSYDRKNANDVQVKIVDQTGQLAIGVVRLKYAAVFNFDNQPAFYFKLGASAEAKYLEIENFNVGNSNPILYDLTNQLRIEAKLDGGKVKIKLTGSTKERELVLINPNLPAKNIITTLRPVRFTNYNNINTNYVLISSKRLRQDEFGKDWIQEYAAYRATPAGGNFDTLVVNVEDLYEQFSYGILRHPLAIRNFAHFIAARQQTTPHFFLIGKSREFHAIRTAPQLAANATYYVPTFGSPGADNLLVASNDRVAPKYPLGRLSVTTAKEIKLYLDKVKQHEDRTLVSAEDRLWRKHIFHLGGGTTNGEQLSIKSSLATMEREAKANAWGAEVTSIFKTSSDPIQESQSQKIIDRINQGVAMMVFFGHASAIAFDISTDDPANYRNFGRYPLVASLGCHSGQIHDAFRSIGEDFVLQENKGAIGFVATTGIGLISALNTLYNDFYKKQGGAYYHQSIGKTLQASLQQFENVNSLDLRALVQQFTLNGDPAIRITPDDAPDYFVDRTTVQFSPAIVNAQQDSIQVSFNVVNAGKNESGKLLLEVERVLPNDLRVPLFAKKIDPPAFTKNIPLKFAVLGEQATGFNRILIKLNSDEKVKESPQPEAAQNNDLKDAFNQAGAPFFVYSNAIVPISPAPFAMVGKEQLKLSASSNNIFNTSRKVFFQLDTTARFFQPLQSAVVTSNLGGVVEWSPELLLQDSTVYYWRVAIEDPQAKDTLWNSSSFLALNNNVSGWNQSHFFQYKENILTNLMLQEDQRAFQYLANFKNISIKNIGLGVIPGITPNLIVGASPWSYLPWDGPINNGIYVAVLDSITVDSWVNSYPGKFGSRLPHPWAKEWAHFPYATTTPEWRSKAIRFLRDTIPNGNYVLIYTLQSDSLGYAPKDWAIDDPATGTSLLKVIEKEGASLFRRTFEEGAKPYVLLYKKGEKLIDEVLAPHADSLVVRNYALPGRWNEGTITSVKIGPAKKWKQFFWNYTNKEAKDQQVLKILGIRADSTQVLLFDNVASLNVDLETISAQEFPYLKLQYYTKDSILRTTPQLQYWRVLYDGLPDAALHPDAGFSLNLDTLQQGQALQLDLAISNLGDTDMDSMKIAYTISGPNGKILLEATKIGNIKQKQTIQTKWNFTNTAALEGKQQLKIEANPDNNPTEVHRFNNVGFVPFWVEKDRRNPLLDVTFDGIHILDKDLISPKPVIIITLKDENIFLPLNKPEFFSLILISPNPENPDLPIESVVDLESDAVQFVNTVEAGKNNQATLTWMPNFTQSGDYTLIVQARDASGNASGALDYKVNFQVITESRLSNVLNYPNPFSANTQFVYTLTGETLPAHYKIQIMTVSGRIVRELTEADLGPLRIGTHRTDFSWDGTDQYGSRLANGVYLYRMVVKNEEGKDFEKYDNGTDRFFKNNIGKLVILR